MTPPVESTESKQLRQAEDLAHVTVIKDGQIDEAATADANRRIDEIAKGLAGESPAPDLVKDEHAIEREIERFHDEGGMVPAAGLTSGEANAVAEVTHFRDAEIEPEPGAPLKAIDPFAGIEPAALPNKAGIPGAQYFPDHPFTSEPTAIDPLAQKCAEPGCEVSEAGHAVTSTAVSATSSRTMCTAEATGGFQGRKATLEERVDRLEHDLEWLKGVCKVMQDRLEHHGIRGPQ